jgi:hypothetical protein
MSIELIAILVTAAFQFAGLIYIASIARALEATEHTYGAKIDRFIREFEQRFALQH